MMPFEILYILHKWTCCGERPGVPIPDLLSQKLHLKNVYNPPYKNEGLAFEYFQVYLHHIDSAGPRLVPMHTPIWVEQESYTEDIWHLRRKTRSFFWSELRSW